MSSASQQQLFLIISRYNLNPSFIPPFKVIIPTLQLLAPVRLYTSMAKQITLSSPSKQVPQNSINSLYQALVFHLENEEGQVDLNQTMNMIYNQKIEQENLIKSKQQESTKPSPWKFRVCILGEQIISWDIVMKFKLKNIVIDTIGVNRRLQQISFATGGINKSPNHHPNIIKLFLVIYSLSTESRKKFNFLSLAKDDQTSGQSIEFTVDCVCCKPNSQQLANEAYACSKCLAIHCSKLAESCSQCGTVFESMNIFQKPC